MEIIILHLIVSSSSSVWVLKYLPTSRVTPHHIQEFVFLSEKFVVSFVLFTVSFFLFGRRGEKVTMETGLESHCSSTSLF